ncbi:extracellular solute-binding protein [Pseudonocardia kongjuensis]|uniref:Extracellular solute-binding protein n=1 Tax=Pseudonocardia kongjuensis TaxID=102227 RepID=A0ABN1XY20_9PSEU
MSSPALSRRGFLGAAGLTAGALLTGCSTAPSPDLTLAYWNFFGGGDGERMVGLVDRFRADHPRIEVRATTLEWGAPYYTKLAMACAGGRAPDLATLHTSRLVTFGRDLLEPWDLAELEARGVRLDDFPPAITERLAVDGELVGLPLDTHPMVLYYNTEICDRAGLLDAAGELRPLHGRDTLLDAGRRAAEVTGAIGIAFAATGTNEPWMLFWSLYNQAGGRMDLPDGGPARVDRDAMVTAMGYLQSFCDGTVASPTLDSDAAVATFASAQSGFLVTGPWEYTSAETAGIPFSMTRFPAVFGDRAIVRADSHCFVVPRQDSVDPAVRSVAYDLAVSMLDDSVSWAEGGHVPALAAVAESPEYLAMQPQSRYRDVVDDVEFDPVAYYSGSGSTMMNRAAQTLQAVAGGGLAPERGADDLTAWLDEQLRLESPL